jgi:hypothetical protein
MFHHAVLVWTTGTGLPSFGTEFSFYRTGPLAHDRRMLDAVTVSGCNKRRQEVTKIQSSNSLGYECDAFDWLSWIYG